LLAYLPVSKFIGKLMEIPETKLKVLKIAAELISAKGFYNVSVREICEAAGVTKPVLYYYFKDKEDVLAELINEGFIQMKELYAQYIDPGASFEANLNGLLKVYQNYADSYPYLIRISVHVQIAPLPEKIKLLSKRRSEELISMITSIFAKGIKEKYFPIDIELGMLVYSLTAPFGILIAESILLKQNTKPLKDNLKKYFDFWKTQFLKKGL